MTSKNEDNLKNQFDDDKIFDVYSDPPQGYHKQLVDVALRYILVRASAWLNPWSWIPACLLVPVSLIV